MHINWSDESKGQKILILVEGATDAFIVMTILDLLKYPGRAEVSPEGNVHSLRKKLHDMERKIVQSDEDSQNIKIISLIDADELSVPDGAAHARKRLGYPQSPVFCAVPTVESWLFADSKLALNEARNNAARAVVSRITSPDTLPEPKELARQVFGVKKSLLPDFFRSVNLPAAMARSASLAAFVEGLVRELGGQHDIAIEAIGSQISRSVFANLLLELPAETISWRTADGEYSAIELSERIRNGDELGFQYVTELLRLARDIIRARSPRGEE